MSLRRKYKKLKQPEFNRIKVLLGQGLRIKQVQEITGRANSTIYIINRVNSLSEYIDFCQTYRKTIGSSAGNSENSLGSELSTSATRASEGAEASESATRARLDEALEDLDRQFESLKSSLINVIVLGVDEKIGEYKKEKEVEIKALKTVVEAARSSNIATVLTERLRKFS